ncbi:Rieske 2Fe-2S family protein [Rhodoligotrophos appendicifer]|uniref:aromatic ring-hydroxylating oxygenase subunit alpha n=1 Tax=Rhodoligotrophos appendicifer TaxID=987056 RepID=UPI001185AF92|nr:aromatic ring-hydroxylating dioxygenase subunit alpha [Rhodoligotrophos appendicifer]
MRTQPVRPVDLRPNIATALERSSYTSPGIFDLEMERIFRKQWLFAGHVSQVREPGHFIVEQVCGESVVIVRETENQIGAFLNVCRHRGHPLVQETSGTIANFTCPYHHWSYTLGGSLRRAPGMADGTVFDYSDFSLQRVQTEIWNGFIFIWLGIEDAPALAALLRSGDGDFKRVSPERVKEVFRESYDIQANWKVLLENYLECYHCAGSHPELCVSMDVTATYASTGSDWTGAYFSGGLQLRPGMMTASLDGRLVSKPLGEFASIDARDLPAEFSAGIGIVPALTRLMFHIDHGVAHSMRPIDVEHVRWETRWYVSEDAVEDRDYRLADVTDVWKRTNAEDISLCEGAYSGVKSARFVPGPLHPQREAAIISALAEYNTLMNSQA